MDIKNMKMENREEVLDMVNKLYHSGAVDHVVEPQIIERSFMDAVGDNPHLKGYVFEENGEIAGFAYLTFFYACEVAGNVVMIEELYIKEKFRGKGIGQNFFQWLFKEFPNTTRFRLEVTKDNRAAHLYERNGFQYINYNQMVYDKKQG